MSQLVTNLAVAAVGAVLLALSVGPLPELAFLLQASGLGALVGLIVARRAPRRFEADSERRWTIIARWTVFGALLGLLAVILIDLHLL